MNIEEINDSKIYKYHMSLKWIDYKPHKYQISQKFHEYSNMTYILSGFSDWLIFK